jgi:hypothetical protein
MRRLLVPGLSAIVPLLSVGCPAPAETTVVPEDPVEVAPADPLVPSEPANRAAGDELEATISVAGGEAILLSSLRGRPVLLEISASWEPGFVEAHELYAQLLAAHPDLAVVVILAEANDEALLGLPSGLTPAWDPAGALAAKLSVATFPTMFVIDRGGRISAVVNGWSEGVAGQLEAAVAEVE